MSNVLFDWRIRDIEQAANEAKSRLWELNALRSDVDRLDDTMRETRAEADGLRAELVSTQDRLNRLESLIEQITQRNSTRG